MEYSVKVGGQVVTLKQRVLLEEEKQAVNLMDEISRLRMDYFYAGTKKGEAAGDNPVVVTPEDALAAVRAKIEELLTLLAGSPVSIDIHATDWAETYRGIMSFFAERLQIQNS